jgi:hypothetical protein
MAEERPSGGTQVTRIFEQPEGAISFYCDFSQVIGTTNEVVLQFYETIPGPPGPGGQMQVVRTRLKATITVSPSHATNIGNLLIKHSTVSVKPVTEEKGQN